MFLIWFVWYLCTLIINQNEQSEFVRFLCRTNSGFFSLPQSCPDGLPTLICPSHSIYCFASSYLSLCAMGWRFALHVQTNPNIIYCCFYVQTHPIIPHILSPLAIILAIISAISPSSTIFQSHPDPICIGQISMFNRKNTMLCWLHLRCWVEHHHVLLVKAPLFIVFHGKSQGFGVSNSYGPQ